MTTVCKLPHLPRQGSEGQEVCDKYGNRWRFDGEEDAWVSRGLLNTPPVVTEDNDGIITTDIFNKLSKLRKFVGTGFDLTPLKILPGQDAYWYYFRSSDKFVRLRAEAENVLRLEVDRGRLFQVLMKEVCPGPKGDPGAKGDRGKAGKPGPPEVCFEPVIAGNRLDFAIHTPTPLLGDRTDITLPNNHVPEISVRVYGVTLPKRNATGLVVPQSYDQLQHLAIYYHPLAAVASAFQRTRELLATQVITGSRDSLCDLSLSRVQALPLGSQVADFPVVTVLVDPLGVTKPRVSSDPQHAVDVNKTLNSIKYDPNTGVVCGSIYLLNQPWAGVWCVKSRQRGPDGGQGPAGDAKIKIVECQLDNSSIIATCPLVNVRVECETRTILTLCSDIINLICVERVRLPANAGSVSDKDALHALFAAAQIVMDDCKLVYRYQIILPDDEFEDLIFPHWDPQPGCVTRRHYDRHNFNWIKDTDISACDDLARWYDPDLVARPGKYPWSVHRGAPPTEDPCCAEDWFYCPNIQDGGCPPGDAPPPPAPPPPAPPPPPPTKGPQTSPQVTITASPITQGVNKPVLFEALVEGGAAPYLYQWSAPEGQSATTKTSTFKFSKLGDKTVKVTVTDKDDRKGSDSIVVHIRP
jgi:hypothetical protein